MMSCRPSLALSVILAAGLAAACQAEERTTASPGPATPTATSVSGDARTDGFYVYKPGEERLFASRLTLAPPAAKADAYDDFRFFNPQRYAITVPPAVDGLRPMVEWEPMTAVVMAVPSDFTPYQNIIDTFVGIIRWSVLATDVWILTNGQSAEDAIVAGLKSAGVDDAVIQNKVTFIEADIDSVWTVDFGPLPLIDTATNTMAFADFRYEHTRVRDDGVPTFLGRQLPALGIEDEALTYRMPLTIMNVTCILHEKAKILHILVVGSLRTSCSLKVVNLQL